jgi:hypothetical protein
VQHHAGQNNYGWTRPILTLERVTVNSVFPIVLVLFVVMLLAAAAKASMSRR